jgi:hypothetical protein
VIYIYTNIKIKDKYEMGVTGGGTGRGRRDPVALFLAL